MTLTASGTPRGEGHLRVRVGEPGAPALGAHGQQGLERDVWWRRRGGACSAPRPGRLLWEVLAFHLLRILSGAGVASPPGGGGWTCLFLRLPHNSHKVKKETKGLWNFRPSDFKKKWNFHLIQVKVPSQIFSSANDRNSLNSVYRDRILKQSVSRHCSTC